MLLGSLLGVSLDAFGAPTGLTSSSQSFPSSALSSSTEALTSVVAPPSLVHLTPVEGPPPSLGSVKHPVAPASSRGKRSAAPGLTETLGHCGGAWAPPFAGALVLRSAYRKGGGTFRHCPHCSGFGHVRAGNRLHGGVDISSPTRTLVHAPAHGQLTYARDPNGYGLFARLWIPISESGRSCTAGDKYELIYAHLIDDNPSLSMEPREVHTGDILGRVGCSGNARGMCSPSPESHLHVSVFRWHHGRKMALDPQKVTRWNILTSPSSH